MKAKCKYIANTLLIAIMFFGASCTQRRYVVYTKELDRISLNIKDTSQVVILVDVISCKPCLPSLINRFNTHEKIVIVAIAAKNINSIKSENNELRKYIKDQHNVQIYFQFSRNNNIYDYALSNKIFKQFAQSKSPIVVLWNEKLGYEIIEPPFD